MLSYSSNIFWVWYNLELEIALVRIAKRRRWIVDHHKIKVDTAMAREENKGGHIKLLDCIYKTITNIPNLVERISLKPDRFRKESYNLA